MTRPLKQHAITSCSAAAGLGTTNAMDLGRHTLGLATPEIGGMRPITSQVKASAGWFVDPVLIRNCFVSYKPLYFILWQRLRAML
jgi:hypothetical protein